MFFSFIFIAISMLLGGFDADTAYATNVVAEPVEVVSLVEINGDSITAYVG